VHLLFEQVVVQETQLKQTEAELKTQFVICLCKVLLLNGYIKFVDAIQQLPDHSFGSVNPKSRTGN